MKLPMLFARTNTGAVQTWIIEVEGNKYRTHYGQIDGAIQITEWTLCAGKNTGKKNATSAEDQAVKEAKSTWKKKKESGYFENINDIDGIGFTEPMLAKSYDDYKDELKYPVYSQPKLDGIRCVVKKDGMWSRNGKPIVSAPHVLVALKPFFDKFPNIGYMTGLYRRLLVIVMLTLLLILLITMWFVVFRLTLWIRLHI